MDFILAKDIFNELYASVDGHAISTAARRRFPTYDRTLTYGEVTPETFLVILNKVKPKKEEVFYDLGSGTGKAVVLASLLIDFNKLIGIELLPELFTTSLEVLARLQKRTGPRPIEFIQADFLKRDFSDADIVFIHSTCFSDTMMFSLERKLEVLKKGARVVTVTKWLQSPQFNLSERKEYPFTWGRGTVSIYEKI